MFQIGTSLLGLAPAQTYWLIRFAILEPLFTCSNMSVISVISIVDILIQKTHQSTSHFGLHPRLPGFDLYRTPPYQEPAGIQYAVFRCFHFLCHKWRSSKRATFKRSCRSSSLFPTYFPHISHFVADQSPPLEDQNGSYHPISLPFGPILWHGKALYHLVLQERQNLGLKTHFVAISVGVYWNMMINRRTWGVSFFSELPYDHHKSLIRTPLSGTPK